MSSRPLPDEGASPMSGPRLVARFDFDCHTFRVVLRHSGAVVLEVLGGQDAMGVERWDVPSEAVSEELCQDITGLVYAALMSVVDGGADDA